MATITQVNSSYTANGTTHNLLLPSSMTNGNLLLLIVANGNSEIPSGLGTYSTIYSRLSSGYRAVCARVIDGAEGTTLTLTVAANTQITYSFIEITDWYGTLGSIEDSEIEFASTTAFPRAAPAHTLVGWGIEDTLWLSLYLADGISVNLVSSPPEFTLATSSMGSLSTGASLYVYQRQSPVLTLPASSWEMSKRSIAETIVLAIRTAAAVGVDTITPDTGVLEI